MRIAIVNSIRAYGGGEKWVLQASESFARRGHPVTVIGQPGSDLESKCFAAGRTFLPVRFRHDLSPVAVFGLVGALRKARADVAICCNERAVRIGALASPMVRRNGRPLPLVYRNGLEASFKNKAHNRWVVGPRVTRFVGNAEAIRREFRSFGWVPDDRIEVVYNGVDPTVIDEADPAGVRAELGAADTDVVALVAARMVPEKGHRLLLDVLARMQPEHRPRVWMAGDGPERAALEAGIAELRLGESVRLLGFRADVPRLLRAADLLCHPSRREGAPNVVLEAMAARLPVVAVAAPGTAELVRHDETGLLAPIGDAETLLAHFRRAVTDAALRRRLGDSGRARVLAEFTVDRSAERWLDLLAACCA